MKELQQILTTFDDWLWGTGCCLCFLEWVFCIQS